MSISICEAEGDDAAPQVRRCALRTIRQIRLSESSRTRRQYWPMESPVTFYSYVKVKIVKKVILAHNAGILGSDN